MIDIIEIKYRPECFEHLYYVTYKIIGLFEEGIMSYNCLLQIELNDDQIRNRIQEIYLNRLNQTT